MKAFFVTVFFLSTFVSPCSWAFTPDLIRGCTAIAEERKSTLGEDAVHAAYCLGVLDGIMTATFQRQKPVPLPYPCFDKQSIMPSEVARQVLSVLRAKPELIELARRSAGDRGAMVTYLALAVSYQCSSSTNGPKK